MKSWFRSGHFTISRGALALFVISWLVFGFYTIHQSTVLSDQQQETNDLAKQNRANQHATGCLIKVLVLNQPNLDPVVVSVLGAVFPHLPETCP